MKKFGYSLTILTILALLTTACNLSFTPPMQPEPPQPGQPEPGQFEPGQPGDFPPGEMPPGEMPPGEPPGGMPPGEPPPGGPPPGEGEPPPGEPPPSEPPPPQPGTGGCPGAPVIPYFDANPASITAGQSTTLRWGNITNGNSSTLVGSAKIEPGLGEVGSGASSRTVKPSKTTTYTLTAKGCGGTSTRQVTVTVSSSGGGGGSLPITPLPAVVAKLDIGITNIYPASTGKIMFTIKNLGNLVVNGSYKVVCSGSYTDSGGNHALNLSGLYANVNLAAGQQADFETGYSRNPSINAMWVSCKITPPKGDVNTSNDMMGMTKVK